MHTPQRNHQRNESRTVSRTASRTIPSLVLEEIRLFSTARNLGVLFCLGAAVAGTVHMLRWIF